MSAHCLVALLSTYSNGQAACYLAPGILCMKFTAGLKDATLHCCTLLAAVAIKDL